MASITAAGAQKFFPFVLLSSPTILLFKLQNPCMLLARIAIPYFSIKNAKPRKQMYNFALNFLIFLIIHTFSSSADPFQRRSSLLSHSGCQCVSKCLPSVYKATPWCHVKASLCSAANTITLNNDDASLPVIFTPPGVPANQKKNDEHNDPFSTTAASANSLAPLHSSQTTGRQNNNNNDDDFSLQPPSSSPLSTINSRGEVLKAIGSILGNFFNLASAATDSEATDEFGSRRFRVLQSTPDSLLSTTSSCKCHQDVVGMWDYCDPSAEEQTRQSSLSSLQRNEYESPPYMFISRHTRTTTAKPAIPLLLLRERNQPEREEEEEEETNKSVEGGGGGVTFDSRIPQAAVQSIVDASVNIVNAAEEEGDKSNQEVEKQQKETKSATTEPATRSPSSHCHPSCKTCTQTSRGLDTECLSCHTAVPTEALDNNNDNSVASDVVKYHLIGISGSSRSSRQLPPIVQGRCVLITEDSDVCHRSCKECRMDCCFKSPRACVSCHVGDVFKPNHHATVGQCLTVLRTPFATTRMIERVQEEEGLMPLILPPALNGWDEYLSMNNNSTATNNNNVAENHNSAEVGGSRRFVEQIQNEESDNPFPFFERPLNPSVSSYLIREAATRNGGKNGGSGRKRKNY